MSDHARIEPLSCLDCGKPDHKHSGAFSTTLEDHLYAVEFYGVCPGDTGVQHRLFPEAFPTPGPYRFTDCGGLSGLMSCWHVIAPDGDTVNTHDEMTSERDAREWAAEYEEDPE